MDIHSNGQLKLTKETKVDGDFGLLEEAKDNLHWHGENMYTHRETLTTTKEIPASILSYLSILIWDVKDLKTEIVFTSVCKWKTSS